ncbi:YceI family protein [Skermanella stibiiresistens]|nr:YceI family protein [Skermanella stibiiresistens]
MTQPIRRARSTTTILGAAALAACMAFSVPASAAPREYRIDPEHASFGFLVSHIGYANVMGMFREVAGSFRFDEETQTLSDVTVTVKTASVFTNHEKRDEHLRKEEFFWTERHPEMTFTMTSAQKTGDRTGKMTGDLSIRGVTKPVTFDVTLNKTGEYPFGGGLFSKPNYVAGASVRGTIRRSEWGMMYGTDNGWVGDDIQLIVEFEGIRQN